MKINVLLSFSVLAFCLLGKFQASGQNEIHYSMFYNAPLNLGSGLTGIFNGDNRFNANYRSQWRTVPVPYTTVSLDYDQKIYPKRSGKYFFAAGGNLNYDFAGDGKFSLYNLNLLGSFTYFISPKLMLTPGINIGVGQRSIQSKGFNFSDSWDGEQVITNPSGEQVSLGDRSFWYPEIGAGLNFRFQQDLRTRVDIGGSANHLNKPRMNFYDGDKSTLPATFAVYGLGSIRVANPIDILLNVAYRKSSEYHETVYGALVKFYLNTQRGKTYAVAGGVDFRTKDAWVPTFELYVNNWKAGVSYDINNSPFLIASDKRGGLELSLQYIMTKVRPLDNNKFCPVY
ncbi:MAG TPA: PorP/SprF family type IX secretion system membrane protein [Saprospiraceae bacterium]|nr:PorP/SprF family type IX secretion system membrane protein [Saprospiraceae bacterium]HQW55261.1 PorP/SprF family type IX secretion system membrane protein [Saprospiraceae bacterium]